MTKMLGDRRIMVQLVDKTEIMAIIPGRFRKRCWMKAGDVLLISRRDFQQDKFDVIHKYNDDEIKFLVRELEIPSFFISLDVPQSDNINFDITTEENVISEDESNTIDWNDI